MAPRTVVVHRLQRYLKRCHVKRHFQDRHGFLNQNLFWWFEIHERLLVRWRKEKLPLEVLIIKDCHFTRILLRWFFVDFIFTAWKWLNRLHVGFQQLEQEYKNNAGWLWETKKRKWGGKNWCRLHHRKELVNWYSSLKLSKHRFRGKRIRKHGFRVESVSICVFTRRKLWRNGHANWTWNETSYGVSWS